MDTESAILLCTVALSMMFVIILCNAGEIMMRRRRKR